MWTFDFVSQLALIGVTPDAAIPTNLGKVFMGSYETWIHTLYTPTASIGKVHSLVEKHLTITFLDLKNCRRHTTCSNVLPFMRQLSTVDYLCCQLIGHPHGILAKQWGTPPVRTHICPIYFPLRDCWILTEYKPGILTLHQSNIYISGIHQNKITLRYIILWMIKNYVNNNKQHVM